MLFFGKHLDTLNTSLTELCDMLNSTSTPIFSWRKVFPLNQIFSSPEGIILASASILFLILGLMLIGYINFMDKKCNCEARNRRRNNNPIRNRKDSIWGVILPDQRRNGRLITKKQKTIYFKTVNFLEDIGCLNGSRLTNSDIDSEIEDRLETGREARFSLREAPNPGQYVRRVSIV